MNIAPSGKALLVLACLVVTACRSSLPIRYYLLSTDLETAQVGTGPTVPAIMIGPIGFPRYLDRPQLVTRNGSAELVLLEQHRWAEPLASNFLSVLAENVAARLGSDQVYTFPGSSGERTDRRLKGDVTRFDVDDTGRAELAIRWQITDGEGAVLAPMRRSTYAQQSAPGDQTAAVEALAATVAKLSSDIVEVLQGVQ